MNSNLLTFIKDNILVNYYIDWKKNNKSLDNYISIKYNTNSLEYLKSIIKNSNEKITTTNLIRNNSFKKDHINIIQYYIKNKDKERFHFTNIDNQKLITFNELLKISGIGYINAFKLYENHNIKSIETLKQKSNVLPLTNWTSKCLKYDNINNKIPRDFIIDFELFIQSFLYILSNFTGIKLKFIICGSYRRGKQISHDIDILFYSEDIIYNFQDLSNINYNSLYEIININKKNNAHILENLLKCFELKFDKKLFVIEEILKKSDDLLYIIAKFKNFDFRLDIRFMPFNCVPAALLYFTGSNSFNIRVRNIAKNKGYLLNEYGLFNINHKFTFNNNMIKTHIKTHSEKDILDILGIKYLEPKDRHL